MALSHSVTQSHNYAVVLGEENGNRRLPIVIGGFEAQAIAVALENMTPNRPLTHDLFKNTLDAFDINLKEVVINNLLDGIFYAQLICEMDGNVIKSTQGLRMRYLWQYDMVVLYIHSILSWKVPVSY